MATFPKVYPGQAFQPLVELENSVRDMVNASQVISGGKLSKSAPTISVSVFNASGVELSAGSAVNFTNAQEVDPNEWIIPCVPFTDADKSWGILSDDLDVAGIGSCIISGPAKVKISNGDGGFVQPDINTPDVFNPADNGVPVVFRQGSEAIINLGGGSGVGSQDSYQFKVIDSTEVSADGIKTLRVSVVNGHSPGNATAGFVNGVKYPRTDIVLSSLTKFYIYAIDGAIYALGHTFASHLIPVLLLATVDVVDGGLRITQESFADNVIVPVAPKTLGATTLTYVITYKDYSLTVTYSVEASAFVNSTPLTLASAEIPANATGKLYAYIKDVIVDPDVEPEAGFAFTVPEGAEFTRMVLQYRLNDSDFQIISRTTDLYFFTFTRIFLNAAEYSNEQ
jgi:hypothetical protein